MTDGHGLAGIGRQRAGVSRAPSRRGRMGFVDQMPKAMPHVRCPLGALVLVLGIAGSAEAQTVQVQAPAAAAAASPAASAEPPKPGDAKPYDEKLVRVAEILGAVHYLRELCGQTDGQQWRDRMREILEADGGSALRRAMLTRGFNSGYRSYGRTYQSCTPTAQTAIGRFLEEGSKLADGMAKTTP